MSHFTFSVSIHLLPEPLGNVVTNQNFPRTTLYFVSTLLVR